MFFKFLNTIMVFYFFLYWLARTRNTIIYTILALGIMNFRIILSIQFLAAIQRTIILFFEALTNMFDIIRKNHILQRFRAILIFTRDNNRISHAYSEPHHWLRFWFFYITKRAMIFALAFLFPLLITIFAGDCDFAFHTYYRFMG